MKHLLILFVMCTGFMVSGNADAGPTADPERGVQILQKSCAGCHNLTGPSAQTISEYTGRKGPDFFYAADKYRAEWIAAWLQNPTRIRPAGMYFFNHVKPGQKRDVIDPATLEPHISLTAEDAEAVAAALMTMTARRELLATTPFKVGPAPLGEMAFDKFYGCLACHEIEPGYGGLSGPELYTAGRRLTPEFMESYIRDPQAWEPKGMMPNKHVPAANLPKLVNFLIELATEFEPAEAQ